MLYSPTLTPHMLYEIEDALEEGRIISESETRHAHGERQCSLMQVGVN